MKDLDRPERLEKLVAEIQVAPAVSDALLIFQRAYDLDFVTYHLALTIADVVDTPYVRTTYKDALVSRYLLRGYVKIDPILREGLIRYIPFDWRDVEVPPSAREFLLDAREHGLGASGFSIPIVDKKRRALLSVNSSETPDEWTKVVSATASNGWTSRI